MPEMRFFIRWPDGKAETCYSPSLVVKVVSRTAEAPRRLTSRTTFLCSMVWPRLSPLFTAAFRGASNHTPSVVSAVKATDFFRVPPNHVVERAWDQAQIDIAVRAVTCEATVARTVNV